jgi:hypothetical protein
MSKRIASLFAALALAMGLLSPSAFAQLSVTATQATGAPGEYVDVTLTIGGTPSLGEPVLSAISAYTFNFLWDASVLSYDGYFVTVPDSVLTAPTHVADNGGFGSLVFSWFTDGDPIDSFAGGLSITTYFQILPTAAYGSSVIAFGDDFSLSNLSDVVGRNYEFSGVSQDDPMQVTVEQSVTPVPEPTEISMLLAGLGLMAAVIRRRKNRQA